MAAKKDFTSINTSPVYSAIAEATAEKKQYKERKTYTAEEQLAALNSMKTAGRKGVKLPRINLAFTPENYEFIRIMAQVRGQSLTEFVNDMLKETRQNHADIYEQAIKFRNSL